MKAAPIVKTVRSGALRIAVRKYADGRYGFDFKADGKDRQKVRAATLAAAVSSAEEMVSSGQAGRLHLLSIDPDEFAEFLAWKQRKQASAHIPALIESFLLSKRAKGRSYKHLRDLEGALRLFGEEFNGPIDRLTRSGVERWLDEREVGPRRWNNLLAVVVALHRWARREGGLSADLTPVELIERKKVRLEVATFSPVELQRLLLTVPDDWRPAIALGAFAGIRPEEVAPDLRSAKPCLIWENVLWGKGKIDVPAVVSKTGRRRFIPLLDPAAQWLWPWRGASGPVVPRRHMSKRTAEWARLAGIAWKPDALRHSYASYRLALTHDLPALSLEMGNSPGMIHRHYLDLKHEEEAEQWFTTYPA